MKILAFAYACDPEHGSEPGAGWAWARMLARIGETWILTRENNRYPIERRLAVTPEAGNLHFIYVDLPKWSRGWKKGGRGARLYYLLWQLAAARRGRALERTESFDLVWHLTFANIWLGSAASLVGPPFIFGPVGGGVGVPWRFLPSMGFRGCISELMRSSGRAAARYLNPLALLGRWQAELILVVNPETQRWLRGRSRRRSIVFPNTVVDDALVDRIGGESRAASETHSGSSHTALFAGRLVPWKGVHLAIGALCHADRWRLRICGSGPDERRLRRLVEHLNLTSRVEFLGVVPRDRVIELMTSSDAFLFPSLHDEGSVAVAEARTTELPVVCLDKGGPPVVGGPSALAVQADTAAAAEYGLSAALVEIGSAFNRRAIDGFFTLDKTSERLRAVLDSANLAPSAGMGECSEVGKPGS